MKTLLIIYHSTTGGSKAMAHADLHKAFAAVVQINLEVAHQLFGRVDPHVGHAADNFEIGSLHRQTARVAAGAGVLADIPAGETWSGYPARPIRQFLRETVWLAKQASSKKAPRES